MTNDNNIQRIQELSEQFDFVELTPEQQQIVLAEITEEEYILLRQTISETTSFFDEEPRLIIAGDSVKPTLDDHQNERSSIFSRIINYNIPLYKIAAAILVLFGLYTLFPGSTETTPNSLADQTNEDNTTYISDTIVSFANQYSSNNSIKYDTGLAQLYRRD